MKAISIRQPWAALIVTGAKDVENRTWTTKHRGPLAIVASAGRDLKSFEAACEVIQRGPDGFIPNENVVGAERLIEQMKLRVLGCCARLRSFPGEDLPRGGIVGIVDLVDIVRDSPSPWAMPGHYHWILANPRTVPFVAVKGRLQLFDVEVTA